ncbi:hypothetical protein ACWDXT_34450 [Streptomyces sp. NPDC003236]
MLRNLDVEFRGNGLPGELYSRLVRNGAVTHMKNMCGPTPADVRSTTPSGWAAEAAAAIGASAGERTAAPGARFPGDPGPLSMVPEQPVPSSRAVRTGRRRRSSYGSSATAVRNGCGAAEHPSRGGS